MRYYTIPPPPSLVSFVRFFWVLESDQPYTHRNLADGCAEMFFHYKGEFDEIGIDGSVQHADLSGMQGPSQYYRRFSTDQGFGMFGVYLYPFAIPQLLNIPATVLTNQVPSLHNLLGNEGKILEEKMMLAKDNNERARIMIEFFEARLCSNKNTPHALMQAISMLIHTPGSIRIEELASQYFLSTRQFERKFKELSGLSPKLYTRILRFQAATREYGNQSKSLTHIAYDCGYYDQSHFINDFKEFSGLHPKAYFSGSTEATVWKD